MSPFLRAALVLTLVVAVGCSGKKSSQTTTTTSPTAPTTPAPPPQPPTPPANRPPVINSMTINPSFGIAQLTQFAMLATASDPDGDALTYSWNFGDGTTGSGASIAKTYAAGSGVATVQLTVSDGRPRSVIGPLATANDTRSIVIGYMTGTWVGNLTCALGPGGISMTLTQNVSVVTGTLILTSQCGNAGTGTTGQVDPAQPGRIDSAGNVQLRIKVGTFIDPTLTGIMGTTGRQITGSISGSGFNGQSFVLNKQ